MASFDADTSALYQGGRSFPIWRVNGPLKIMVGEMRSFGHAN